MNKKQEQERENSNITEVRGELSKKDYKLRGRGARFFIQSFRKNSWEESAFTLIEVLIVLGISVLLITTASLTLFSTKAVRDLQLTGQELSTQIQEIRTRSINQQDGKTWGILFINSPGDESDRYEVFSGPNYASGDVEREFWLQRNVRFIEPPSANNLEVSFDPITGRPNEVAEIILTNASGLEFGITINALGRITTEFDR